MLGTISSNGFGPSKVRLCSWDIGARIKPEPVEHSTHVGAEVLRATDKVHNRFPPAEPESAAEMALKHSGRSNEIRKSAVFGESTRRPSEEIRRNQFFVWLLLETELEIGVQKLRVLTALPERSHNIVVTAMLLIVLSPLSAKKQSKKVTASVFRERPLAVLRPNHTHFSA